MLFRSLVDIAPVDPDADPVRDARAIVAELKKFSKDLATKPRWLVINKADLLPADEAAADEEDGPDPREELVRRLLEYKTYKEAARQLDGQEKMWREIFSREPEPLVDVEPEELSMDNVSLFDLVDALKAIVERNPGGGKTLIEIVPDNLTVRERMNVILETLEGKDSVAFAAL